MSSVVQPQYAKELLAEELKALKELDRKLTRLDKGDILGRIVRQLEAGFEKFVRAIFQRKIMTRQEDVVNTLNYDLDFISKNYKVFSAQYFRNLEDKRLKLYHEINSDLLINLTLMEKICGKVRFNAPKKITEAEIKTVETTIEGLKADIVKVETILKNSPPLPGTEDYKRVALSHEIKTIIFDIDKELSSIKVPVEMKKKSYEILEELKRIIIDIEKPDSNYQELAEKAKTLYHEFNRNSKMSSTNIQEIDNILTGRREATIEEMRQEFKTLRANVVKFQDQVPEEPPSLKIMWASNLSELDDIIDKKLLDPRAYYLVSKHKGQVCIKGLYALANQNKILENERRLFENLDWISWGIERKDNASPSSRKSEDVKIGGKPVAIKHEEIPVKRKKSLAEKLHLKKSQPSIDSKNDYKRAALSRIFEHQISRFETFIPVLEFPARNPLRQEQSGMKKELYRNLKELKRAARDIAKTDSNYQELAEKAKTSIRNIYNSRLFEMEGVAIIVIEEIDEVITGKKEVTVQKLRSELKAMRDEVVKYKDFVKKPTVKSKKSNVYIIGIKGPIVQRADEKTMWKLNLSKLDRIIDKHLLNPKKKYDRLVHVGKDCIRNLYTLANQNKILENKHLFDNLDKILHEMHDE